MTENEAIKELTNENTQIVIGNLVAIKLICKKFENAEETIDMAIQALEKVQQYEAIGTVEEFKALKEKNEPKKPRVWANGTKHCPNEDCEEVIFSSDEYCLCCGQKLDWQ